MRDFTNEHRPISADFSSRLQRGLRQADRRKRRLETANRWRGRALVIVPLAAAACWAAMPWTFGIGVRALIGFTTYLTVALSIANRADHLFLAYLGIGTLPVLIDGLLLVGLVSWLSWAGSSDAVPSATRSGERTFDRGSRMTQ